MINGVGYAALLIRIQVDLSAKKGFQERLNAVQLALEEIEEKAADLTKEERAIRTEGSTIQKEAVSHV